MLGVVPVAPRAVSQPPIPYTLELYQETRRCNGEVNIHETEINMHNYAN